LDINALVVGSNPQVEQKKRLQRLFTDLGLDNPANLVAALIDWLDSDNEVYYKDGAVGAESAYYLRMDPPYRAHNGSIASMAELALVRGFSPEVVARIRPFITLYGNMRVNCNSAPAEVMATLYLNSDQPVSLDDVQSIVQARRQTPFKTVSDFSKAFPALALLYPTSSRLNYSLKVSSDFYRIVSQAWINDGTATVTAVVQKSKSRILYLKVD
jgi:general secretion pathway protein K